MADRYDPSETTETSEEVLQSARQERGKKLLREARAEEQQLREQAESFSGEAQRFEEESIGFYDKYKRYFKPASRAGGVSGATTFVPPRETPSRVLSKTVKSYQQQSSDLKLKQKQLLSKQSSIKSQQANIQKKYDEASALIGSPTVKVTATTTTPATSESELEYAERMTKAKVLSPYGQELAQRKYEELKTPSYVQEDFKRQREFIELSLTSPRTPTTSQPGFSLTRESGVLGKPSAFFDRVTSKLASKIEPLQERFVTGVSRVTSDATGGARGASLGPLYVASREELGGKEKSEAAVKFALDVGTYVTPYVGTTRIVSDIGAGVGTVSSKGGREMIKSYPIQSAVAGGLLLLGGSVVVREAYSGVKPLLSTYSKATEPTVYGFGKYAGRILKTKLTPKPLSVSTEKSFFWDEQLLGRTQTGFKPLDVKAIEKGAPAEFSSLETRQTQLVGKPYDPIDELGYSAPSMVKVDPFKVAGLQPGQMKFEYVAPITRSPPRLSEPSFVQTTLRAPDRKMAFVVRDPSGSVTILGDSKPLYLDPSFGLLTGGRQVYKDFGVSVRRFSGFKPVLRSGSEFGQAQSSGLISSGALALKSSFASKNKSYQNLGVSNRFLAKRKYDSAVKQKQAQKGSIGLVTSFKYKSPTTTTPTQKYTQTTKTKLKISTIKFPTQSKTFKKPLLIFKSKRTTTEKQFSEVSNRIAPKTKYKPSLIGLGRAPVKGSKPGKVSGLGVRRVYK